MCRRQNALYGLFFGVFRIAPTEQDSILHIPQQKLHRHVGRHLQDKDNMIGGLQCDLFEDMIHRRSQVRRQDDFIFFGEQGRINCSTIALFDPLP